MCVTQMDRASAKSPFFSVHFRHRIKSLCGGCAHWIQGAKQYWVHHFRFEITVKFRPLVPFNINIGKHLSFLILFVCVFASWIRHRIEIVERPSIVIPFVPSVTHTVFTGDQMARIEINNCLSGVLLLDIIGDNSDSLTLNDINFASKEWNFSYLQFRLNCPSSSSFNESSKLEFEQPFPSRKHHSNSFHHLCQT